ncbi:unnamed protein product [Peronospora belbahrii]|uniref:RxLR effector protein n=1 Tax=Peronospora belbahrii TaxID=622444 RepID=A0AAU9KPV9_9STRA|nr:unnamed protein product [Peronospora belbahrii]
MRFIFFLSLLLTTFVLSSDTFVSAETNAVKNYSYDRTNVRRLRGESNVEEERIDTHGAEGAVEHLLPAAMAEAATPAIQAAEKTYRKSDEEIAKLAQKIVDTHELWKLENEDLARLAVALSRAQKSDVKKWSLFMIVLIASLTGTGVGFATYALYQLLTPYGA